MPSYRYQVVSVGFWRGKIKRWSTTFHTTSTGSTASLYTTMQATGWPNPGDATGACSGGVASITVYESTGGAPIRVTEYFDWEDPSTWIPFGGQAWGSVDPDTPVDASGESALLVVGNMPGLSASGKPVTTRKYLHQIPNRTATDYADPDVSSADQAAIAGFFGRAIMCNPAGAQPDTVTVEPYYFNHQRVRGRRRPRRQDEAGAFSAGVVVGAGAAASDDAAPFRN